MITKPTHSSDSMMTEEHNALTHLGEVLAILSELHPSEQCKSYVDALKYYNEQRPDFKIVPMDGYTTFLTTFGPPDYAMYSQNGIMTRIVKCHVKELHAETQTKYD